jgi:hypothetical protein
MRCRVRIIRLAFAALLTSALGGVAAGAPAMPAGCQQALEQYNAARQAYEDAASAYWAAVGEKRRTRNGKRRNNEDILIDDYVLGQPPVYAGPPMPADPSAPPATPPAARKRVPVVADFLASAAKHFGFVPRRPRSEIEFKRAYAQAAAAAGLARDQVVRIYAFESGGNGRYDVQAGLEYDRPGARAIHTALGYNQLVGANGVGLLAEQGDRLVAALRTKAASSAGDMRTALEAKGSVLERMIAFARTVPDEWREHEKLAETPAGLGIHALLLDLDVGPLLQTRKLLDSVEYARRRGYGRPLSAAELELMNFTGDGNGFDMVTMPDAMREKVPTANFFVRAGYERNPIARRHGVVAKLLAEIDARMDAEARLQGATDMAAAFDAANGQTLPVERDHQRRQPPRQPQRGPQ